MPLWMERLKLDKSRTVREACALYLGQALMSWTEEGYLTEEIWMQVGTVLIRTLRDPSPDVRTNAKAALEKMRNAHPTHWDSLNDPTDPPKMPKHKMAQNIRTGRADQDELSVNSKFLQLDSTAGTTNESRPTQQLPIPLISMPPSQRRGGVGGSWIHVHVDRSRRIFSAEKYCRDQGFASKLLGYCCCCYCANRPNLHLATFETNRWFGTTYATTFCTSRGITRSQRKWFGNSASASGFEDSVHFRRRGP
jgi:hypothetical protein